jgi:glycerol-1-phosphate dehydrogenase [NAD(P)+]
MTSLRSILVPRLVRLKAGALDRLAVYLERNGWSRVLLLRSDGLPPAVQQRLKLAAVSCSVVVEDASLEWLAALEKSLEPSFDAVVAVGGGKALDVAKLFAYRNDLPYVAVPTSLSNDGFCSPQSSLTVAGRKTTLPARLPVGVVVDLEVVGGAPESLWLSGIGDLVAKRTAIRDWKIAFHSDGTPFDDLAALLSDASVFQFMAHPTQDLDGVRLLAQALLLNGVAMEIAGSSRPASGSEHLISHGLDLLADPPHLHGLQVGLATYWMARLQNQDVDDLDDLFERTGFWRYWREHPMPRMLWLQALQAARTVKKNFISVLSDPGSVARATALLENDSRLLASLT